MTNTSIYTLGAEGAKHIQYKLLLKTVVFSVGAIASSISISSVPVRENSTLAQLLPYSFSIILIVVAYGIVQYFRLQSSIWSSYALMISEDQIIQRNKKDPIVQIDKNEIEEITILVEGDVLIKSKQNNDRIFIPKSIDQKETLLKELSGFANLEVRKNIAWKIFRFSVPYLMICLMSIFAFSKSTQLILITGSILSFLLTYWFFNVQVDQYKNVKIKASYYVLLLLLLSFVGRMFLEFYAI